MSMTRAGLSLTAAVAMLASALGAAPTPAGAQELRIGMKAAVDGADPHQLYTPNRNLQLHVYEPLLWQDERLHPQPRLAASWRVVDPLTWEFTLREGIAFQDGSPLTADDVAFSIRRAQQIEGARTYRVYVRDIASVEATGPRTVRIRTRAPAPSLPSLLTSFGIVSARAAQDATPADFNGGRAAVGTGPYRWIRFTPGQDVVLERHAGYWGGAEPWSRVTFRFVPNDSARVAALLAGDLDVIDTVPPGLYARVRGSERTHLLTATSSFTLYMQLDQKRDRSPFAVGADGQPLERNPLRDRRVRQAINHALNREAIAERAMEGAGEPAGQLMPLGFIGHVPGLTPPPFDPARARQLLAEAGYPQGFGMTVHCTSDRFAGDARVCQAVGQMLTAVGIRAQVDAMPAAVFFRRAGTATTEPEFSMLMSIFSALPGTASENMAGLLRTYDPATGLGTSNRGRYSNPELDRLLATADATMDDAERERLVARAVTLAMEDAAALPIFFWKGSWGLRRGLAMTPRGDQYTYATDIRPAP
jgi:peptide/nickel transport system substrate-binding protein